MNNLILFLNSFFFLYCTDGSNRMCCSGGHVRRNQMLEDKRRQRRNAGGCGGKNRYSRGLNERGALYRAPHFVVRKEIKRR